MMFRTRRLLVATGFLGLLLSGCSGTDGPSSADFTMSGNWEQGGQLQDRANGDTHYHLGSFSLTQSGDQFSGNGQQSGLCHTATNAAYQGPLSDPTPFAITNGHISGMNVSFDRDICHYSGSFAPGNPNKLDGQATCTYTSQGTSYTFTGTWGAARENQ